MNNSLYIKGEHDCISFSEFLLPKIIRFSYEHKTVTIVHQHFKAWLFQTRFFFLKCVNWVMCEYAVYINKNTNIYWHAVSATHHIRHIAVFRLLTNVPYYYIQICMYLL